MNPNLFQSLLLRMFYNIAKQKNYQKHEQVIDVFMNDKKEVIIHENYKDHFLKYQNSYIIISQKGKITKETNFPLSSLISIKVPTEIEIPEKEKAIYYPNILENATGTRFTAQKLIKEVLSGKMEVAQGKVFNSMEDYMEHITKDKLNWHDASKDWHFWDRNLRDFYSDSYGHAYHSGKNLITIGYYYLRYKV